MTIIAWIGLYLLAVALACVLCVVMEASGHAADQIAHIVDGHDD